MRRLTEDLFLRHNFTEQEIRDKGLAQSQAYERLINAELEKKAAVSQFAERIAQEKSLLGKLSREITVGWESRAITCRIDYNDPNVGMKTFYRNDTSEKVKTVSMLPDEMQETLFKEPQKQVQDEQQIAENIKNFFGLTQGETPDIELYEVQGYALGDWWVVAHSEELAQKFLADRGITAKGDEALNELDQDATLVVGLEQIFGTDSLPLRKAIAVMIEQGFSFPSFLRIPEGHLKALHEGKSPDNFDQKGEQYAQDGQGEAPKKKRGRPAKKGSQEQAGQESKQEQAPEPEDESQEGPEDEEGDVPW